MTTINFKIIYVTHRIFQLGSTGQNHIDLSGLTFSLASPLYPSPTKLPAYPPECKLSALCPHSGTPSTFP